MRSLHPLATAVAVLLAAATVGCATGKDEMTKRLDELSKEVVTLRASNAALKDRLDAMEIAPKSKSVSGEEAAETDDRPALEVVHIAPTDEPSVAEPEVVVAPASDEPPIDIVGDENGVETVQPGDKAKKKKPKRAKHGHSRYSHPKHKPKHKN